MPARPTIWPHLVVEDGPPIAGLEPGDAIAFAPERIVMCGLYKWGARFELAVRVEDDHDDGDEERRTIARRVISDPLRLEIRHTTLADWSAVAPEQHVIGMGPWRLRFVLDGPPLATVKRFGPHLAAHCRAIGGANRYHGERTGMPGEQSIYTEWLLPANGAARSLLVIERPSGEVLHRVRPRMSGVGLFGLETLLYGDRLAALKPVVEVIGGPRLDPELAAGIAMQADDDQSGVAYVGYDGVLRHVDDERGASQFGCRARIYARLMRLADLETAKAQLATTRAATVEEVGAFISALDPERAARDAALVEECGVLAG